VQTADNNEPKTARAAEKRSQAENEHCNTTAIFYGVTGTRTQGNHEINSRKASESKESGNYTKLDAFVQPRLCTSQGTEAIRKSTLPFSLLYSSQTLPISDDLKIINNLTTFQHSNLSTNKIP
jgi:hypothetical protein